MKFTPRKIANSIIFIYFLCLSAISVLLFTFITIDFEMTKLSQGFYSDNAISFTIESRLTPPDYSNEWLNSLKNMDNYIIYKELGFQSDLRGIQYSGTIGKPPMLSGRFFQESDFNNNEGLAVVGANYRETMHKVNDAYYININHKSYKVIGMMGYKHKSRLDRICLVNLNTLAETQFKDGLYIIDGPHKKRVNENFMLLGNDLESKYNKSVNIISQSSNSIARFFSIKNLQVKLLIYALLTVSIVSLSLVHYWYRSNENEMKVMSLIGFHKHQIFLSTSYQFLKIIGIAISICVSLALFGVLIIAPSSYMYVLKAILISVISTFGIGIVSLLLAMFIIHFQNTSTVENVYENDIQ